MMSLNVLGLKTCDLGHKRGIAEDLSGTDSSGTDECFQKVLRRLRFSVLCHLWINLLFLKTEIDKHEAS